MSDSIVCVLSLPLIVWRIILGFGKTKNLEIVVYGYRNGCCKTQRALLHVHFHIVLEDGR